MGVCSNTQKKQYNIQYLRVLCALMVFFSHYTMNLNVPAIISFRNSLFAFMVDGGIAVSMFFVLSGFFYYKTNSLTIKGYVLGVLRKALHIFPAHIFVLVFGMILCNCHFSYDTSFFTDWGNSFWNVDITWVNFFRESCCVFPSPPKWMINPSSWYLEFEVWFFIIMPLLVGVFLNYPLKYTLILFIVFIAVLGVGLGMRFFVYNLLSCCLGALACRLTLIFDFKFLQTGVIKVLWLILSILLLIHSHIICFIVTPSFSSFYFFTEIGAAMLLIFLWKVKMPHIAAFEYLGDISYEFYLVQQVVLISLRPVYMNPIQYLVVSLSISVLLALLLNNFLTSKLSRLLK